MRKLLVVMTVAVALGSGACGSRSDDESGGAGTATTAPSPRVAAGTLTERACNFEQAPAVTADCSWLTVPEDRAAPDGRKVRLPVVVLHRATGGRDAVPVIFLHGGPGEEGLPTAANWRRDVILATDDIVLFDQRGGGKSKPSLECPEVNADIFRRFSRLASYTDEVTSRRTALRSCRDRLVDEGIDLDQYDSEANAADVESLRLALDVDQWNLLGVSYGTRLALTYLRSFPGHTRSVLLDSVYPTTVGGQAGVVAAAERAIDRLSDGCTDDPACSAAYPEFTSAVDRAYRTLNEHPFEGDVDLGPDHGGPLHVKVNGGDAIGGLYTALYDRDLLPLLPKVIEAIAHGDTSLIPVLAQKGIPIATQPAAAAAVAFNCADNAGLFDARDRALIDDPGRFSAVISEYSASYCDVFDVAPTSKTYNEPVRSDVPALVFAGEYDPVTPPGDSEATANLLTHATYAQFDGIGHAVLFSDDCARSIYKRFLTDPEAPVDTTCASTHPGPDFAVG